MFTRTFFSISLTLVFLFGLPAPLSSIAASVADTARPDSPADLPDDLLQAVVEANAQLFDTGHLSSRPHPGELQVNVQGAAYPMLADPLVYSEQKVIASGAAGDQFGFSVALSGDGNTALVGAWWDDVGGNANQGSAYVFTRSGSIWSQQAHLSAANGAAGDYFGGAIALSGDGNTALVGVWMDDVGSNIDQGTVYVFIRSGSTWTQQAQLTAIDGAAGDIFGNWVMISGDTILVGARGDDIGPNEDQGSAYVFTRSGSTWSQQAKLSASDGAEGDWFGISVALSNDTALVGVYSDDVGLNVDQGSAYVFTRSGSTWSQQARLTASDGEAGDHFGYPVALAGDTALVGAWWDDVGANDDQGSAYVFTRSGSIWSEQAHLVAADGAAGDFFGGDAIGLSGDGSIALVGVGRDDVGGNDRQGSAYVFTRGGSTWSQQAHLIAADGEAGDYFGYRVALSGDGNTALVGAWGDDIGENGDQGSAYFFTSQNPAGTFGDVPASYWAYSWIERLYDSGITAGCSISPLMYCPDNPVSRAQMAVFLLRGIHSSTYQPPAVGAGTGFNDVVTGYWAEAWIKQLAIEGITLGCGGGNYCPEGLVTRAQMALFLLRSKHGATYTPPAVGAGTGFGDVSSGYWAAAWIKQLAAEGITTGCGGGNYCPEDSVTRAQMAVFLVRTFNLP